MKTYLHWNEADTQWLIENYSKYGRKYCSDILNIPVTKIANMAARLNLRHQKNNTTHKLCPHCNTEKPFSDFNKTIGRKFNIASWCKACHNESQRLKKNKPRKPLLTPEERRERDKQSTKRWRQNNKEYIAKREKEKRSNNIPYRVLSNLRFRFKSIFNQRSFSKNQEIITGCNLQYMMQHLESQFKEDMVWENYGEKGWQIDHIIPVSFLKRCHDKLYLFFNYRNHQLLWPLENNSKGNNLLIAKEHLLSKIGLFGLDTVYQEMLELVDRLINENSLM